jgi:hypothetical protein
MELSPIASLAALSPARPAGPALEPLPMARVENSARNGDDAYSPSNGKASRGSEDSESEETREDPSAGTVSDPSSSLSARTENHRISFFA